MVTRRTRPMSCFVDSFDDRDHLHRSTRRARAEAPAKCEYSG
jgi:hypothetical protein